MLVENALVANAQPRVIKAKLSGFIQKEIHKGCRPELSPHPLSLESKFTPLWLTLEEDDADHLGWVSAPKRSSRRLIRLRLWIPPEYKFSWKAPELFIKQLQPVVSRVCFEIFGNNHGVTLSLLVDRSDLAIVEAAFRGEFEFCEINQFRATSLLQSLHTCSQDVRFRDYFPSPPYSHLLTCPSELASTPLKPVITAMAELRAPAVGLYQVVFKPVSPRHNWHRNVRRLLDFEYAIKLMDGFSPSQRYAQQSPSGDLHHMAGDVEEKAHNDKPFFAVALRTAVMHAGDTSENYLNAISTFSGLFQHGGRPLNYITEQAYANVLAPDQICDMFVSGTCHRPGFLVNSFELNGLVHLPPLNIFEHRQVPLYQLELLTIKNEQLRSGTWIGTCDHAGETQQVCIPDYWRKVHLHLIGGSGKGKSTTLEHIIMQDIQQGHGVAVLDPHGDLVEAILRLIPKEHIHRTIYFNPGDPDWVTLWNPLERIPGQDSGQTANNIVKAIESFVAGGGWGDRVENILRNLIYALIQVPRSTFLDIGCLLRNQDEGNQLLIREIMNNVDNETARHFWRHDYKKYRLNELGPPINKIGKLLISDTVSPMLSQPENRIRFRQIMDEGKILLIDLSTLDTNIKMVLGCFILSLLHLNALSRRDIKKEARKQFFIFCDEAHQFISDTPEHIISETRKYSVGLSLAHQYLSQFGKTKIDALSTVGSSIIFNVDSRDAQYLTKDLQGKVKAQDLVSLENFEAVVRIGTEVLKIKTRPPLSIPDRHYREEIIKASRQKYCKPAHEIRKLIRRRNDRWDNPFCPLSSGADSFAEGTNEEFEYDEFE